MEKKVLIVDDEESIRVVFRKAFERDGWEVRTAGSGEEALEIMRETPSMVLFLDLNLPGMSGVELSRRIRRQWPMAISFAVTGYSSLFELTDCREAGFEDYFTKPVDLEMLLEAAAGAASRIQRWKGMGKKDRGVFLPL